ncbi:uncharacterized protein LOC126842469 [Adelges cooleyi]|uniref:uncharacterized protein LOC126833133 n=1 Tax=Adelges cooleyi TaxID=133065 RepID=UPI00217FA337|nr:uncharacterized protein LOC126833133 [Adelges cooleyi]XP_050435439.1 uncharacterized protein LOC126842469 [Adelges cooleyi]
MRINTVKNTVQTVTSSAHIRKLPVVVVVVMNKANYNNNNAEMNVITSNLLNQKSDDWLKTHRQHISELQINVPYKVLGFKSVKTKFSSFTPVVVVQMGFEKPLEVYLPPRYEMSEDEIRRGVDPNLKLRYRGKMPGTNVHDIVFE